MAEKKKKKNFIVAYLTPFGLKQICDILMVVAAIVLIIGLFISGSGNFVVAIVGSVLMALSAALVLVRTVSVLLKNGNRRSMAYKNAITNTVIMGVIFALSVFAVIYISIALL